MGDSQEDEDTSWADLISQSTQEQSFDSISGSQTSFPSTSKFIKYPWLLKYFEQRTDEKVTKTYCKGCKQGFSNRGNQRLFSHYSKCLELKVLKDKENESPVKMMQNLSRGESDTNKWLKVMVENNISLKAIDSKSFREWVKDSHSTWQPPSRQQLSNMFIPKYSQNLHAKFLMRARNSSRPHLSIEFDGWKDQNNRSFLGVIATEPSGRKHLLDLRDISLKSHTSAVLVEELQDILKSLPAHVINSIMSDSAANCKKAREDLIQIEPYKHLIQHRCLAHLFNLIGSKLTSKNQPISKLLNEATAIASLVSSSSYWNAYFKKNQMKKINQPCQVRWYSNVNMLVTLVELKAVILEKVAPSLSIDKKEIVATFDWVYLDEVLEVLKPINHCIGCLERNDVSLGEAVNEILTFARGLFNLTPSETVSAAKKAFLSYFNVSKLGRAEFGLYIAAYVLDPRFRFAYVTEEGIDLAFEAITRVALKSGVKLATVKSCLHDDYETYKLNVNKTIIEGKNEAPARWWSSRMIGAMLARVGIRLANLKASSANIERTFSTVKYIQSGNRLNFQTSTLVHIARLKVSLQQEKEEDIHWINEDDSSAKSQLDQSCNSSFESQSQELEINISNLTGSDEQNWIEDEDVQTKRDYQGFFHYFDFEVPALQPKHHNLDASDEVTEDQINECVGFLRVKRGTKRSRILGESSSQSQQNEVIEEAISNSEDDNATYFEQYEDFQR